MGDYNKFDSIIFDVDGTLWDVREAVAHAWSDVISELTDWEINFDGKSLGAMFGKTMDTIFFHFYPNSTKEEYEKITGVIYKRQKEYLIKYAPELYEGVAKTLERLSHRYKLFIVTNAQRGYIDTVFAVHDVRKYFTDWMCFGDTNASKDVTIRKIIERNNLKNAVYVGDTQGDADSCDKVGIPIVYAAYGLGKVEKPWRSIDKFSELEDILLENSDSEGFKRADVSNNGALKADDISEKNIAAGKIDTVIFDLDGTLLYTIEDLAASTNHALQQYGMPERTLEEVTAFVGNGVAKLIERAVVPGTDKELFDKVFAEFKKHYAVHNLDHTRPYPGIVDMLTKLKEQGYKVAVVSNKLQSATQSLCEHFFGELVPLAVGDNPNMAKKPEADMVNEALYRLNRSRANAVYVGDSEVDIETAKNSGMKLIMVEWGFRKRADMEKLGVGCFIDKPEKIFDVLNVVPEHPRRAETDNKILQLLRGEKDIQLSGGLYHELQIRMTYNSNHIEGSKLSETQTRLIFETNTIDIGDGIPVDDILETVHHFRAIDYCIDIAEEELTEEIIKKLHYIIKHDTKDSTLSWFAVGDYKKRANMVGGRETSKPSQVQEHMRALLEKYNAKDNVTIEDIVEFHAEFEYIHPFQDGNGRVGRLIALKECLKNNIIPFIIEDSKKGFYYRGLSEWKNEKGWLVDTCLDGQDTFIRLLDMLEIPHN